MVKTKHTRPLAEPTRLCLAQLIEGASVASLARRWSVGQPTIARAVRGGGLTPAMSAYITMRAVTDSAGRTMAEHAAA